MTTTVKFAVAGKPLPKGSHTAFVVGRGRDARAVITDSQNKANQSRSKGALDAWESCIRRAAIQAMGERTPWPGPVAMSAVFVIPVPAGHILKSGTIGSGKSLYPLLFDLDKLVRTAGDAATGVVYRDDRQIREFRPPFMKRFAAPGKIGGVFLEFDLLPDSRPCWENQCDMDLAET